MTYSTIQPFRTVFKTVLCPPHQRDKERGTVFRRDLMNCSCTVTVRNEPAKEWPRCLS